MKCPHGNEYAECTDEICTLSEMARIRAVDAAQRKLEDMIQQMARAAVAVTTHTSMRTRRELTAAELRTIMARQLPDVFDMPFVRNVAAQLEQAATRGN
jgi:CHASE1-domain containing sensor protein